MFDIVIKGGKILDGSGGKAYRADIGIKNEIICEIGSEIDTGCADLIHADGYTVCPGFIDIHSHSDFSLIHNPRAESKVMQGVTTEIVGNCGFSPGPVNPSRFDELMQYLVNTVAISEEEKKVWKYRSQGEFLCQLENCGIAVNIASLVGHGTIKVAAMGFKKEEPSRREHAHMAEMLINELEQGVFGLSSGLQYEPGVFSTFDEMEKLLTVLKGYNGIYSTHLKSEGKHLLECLDEAARLAALTGVSLEISHLKAEGRSNWGKVEQALELIDEAYGRGVDVGFDLYPYTAFGSGLMDLLPPWTRELGSGRMVDIINDAVLKERILRDMKSGLPGWENPMEGMSWDRVRIASVASDKNKKYEGLNLMQISEEIGCTPADAVLRLVADERGAVKMVFFGMREEDIITVMKHPRTMFCTDGRAVAPYGRTGKGKPHPRYYGTYPRILGHYVRDLRVIPIEEAVKKMTLLPAEKMNLKRRGQLKKGNFADIVVFDENTVMDRATFDEPHSFPQGIMYVLVNGQAVVWKGEHTGRLPGKILRKT
ncbi:MAG: D-aminoacylase [Bacillota bacterium]|nr:D-aminoacylase [Bacillota bacterium]